MLCFERIASCTRGRNLCKRYAVSSGNNSSGSTCLHIVRHDWAKPISVCAPIKEKYMGESMATARLLRRLYETSTERLPPSMAATTGADVAVGQKMQMNAPSATAGSQSASRA